MKEKIVFKISGMTCNKCAEKIKNKLDGYTGVLSVNVCFEQEQADIEYNKDIVDRVILAKQIEDLGYGVD